MDGSVATALSMVVSILDLAHTYMEAMETARDNLHASGMTYSPQGCSFLVQLDADFQEETHLSSATTGHGWE